MYAYAFKKVDFVCSGILSSFLKYLKIQLQTIELPAMKTVPFHIAIMQQFTCHCCIQINALRMIGPIAGPRTFYIKIVCLKI